MVYAPLQAFVICLPMLFIKRVASSWYVLRATSAKSAKSEIADTQQGAHTQGEKPQGEPTQ